MMRTRRLISICMLMSAAAFAAACDGPTLPVTTASPYQFRLSPDSTRVLRWPSGTRVRVYVSQATTPALNDLLLSAFTHGAAQWNAQALFGEYELVRANTLQDADVLLGYSTDPPVVATSDCVPAPAVGATTFCVDTMTTPQRLKPFPLVDGGDTGHIVMLVSILPSQSSINGRVDALVAHELGHVLGIAQHSPNPDDLMAAGLPSRSTLSTHDIATIQRLYQTPPDVLPEGR